MATQKQDNERIPWVKGNTLNLSVPLQLVTVNNGQQIKTDYTPPAGSDIHVLITGRFGGKEYPYTISGNVVSFKDDGMLQVGCYGVEITVSEPQTEQMDGQKRRTFKQDIEIFNSLDELGTLPDGEIVLDAAIFVQGQKGDKGDQGEVGPPGTTDYNELENKPDLSVYMERVTEEQFDEIFD